MRNEIDMALAEAVAHALTAGQGEFDDAEFAQAYQRLFADRLAGDLAALTTEGKLGLLVDGEEVKYASLGGKPLPEPPTELQIPPSP